jgi:cold shock CspA family protein
MARLERTSSVSVSTNTSDFSSSSILRYTGRVKWFNVKSGYGFITPVITHGNEEVDRDVFVHHTSITVGTDQYKYLTEGEYVDFCLERAEPADSSLSTNTFHKYHAVDVTGVARGYLLCETRFASILVEQTRKTRAKKDSDPTFTEEARQAKEAKEAKESGAKTYRDIVSFPRMNAKTPRGSADRTSEDSDEFAYPTQKKTFKAKK